MEKPPYQITNKILKLISEIQKSLGYLSGQTLSPLPLKLRKEKGVQDQQLRRSGEKSLAKYKYMK